MIIIEYIKEKGGMFLESNLSKNLLFFVLGFVLMLILPSFLAKEVFASQLELEPGVYSIDYEILRADNDSVSIANDYFDKPAYIIVQDDKEYIQFSINHSEWTKELQAPLGEDFVDVEVLGTNEEEDTRIVQFELDRSIDDPLEFKMHVLIEEMDPVYDHRYTVRFDFDEDSIEEASEDDVIIVEDGSEADGSSNSIVLWGIILGLLIILVLAIIILKKKKGDKENEA